MKKDTSKGGESEMEIVKVEKTIYRDVCPYCNKEISSQYLNQLRFNYDQHIRFCKNNPSSGKTK